MNANDLACNGLMRKLLDYENKAPHAWSGLTSRFPSQMYVGGRCDCLTYFITPQSDMQSPMLFLWVSVFTIPEELTAFFIIEHG